MGKLNRYKSAGERLRLRAIRLLARLGFGEDAFLIVLACMIGVLTGLGSVGFTKLIEWSHRLCYGGSNHGLYGGHAYLLIVLPAAGALLVGLITNYFAREAKGHGVPEVMDAIARKDGMIRPQVALAKAVASALTIGSGGAAGTEGPIVQIGAALGSAGGQMFKVVKHNMPVLVGCGAAACISAIFHAPIAGVLFALEIFLCELNFKTFSPIMIASVLSSVTTKAVLGSNEAIFPLFAESFEHASLFEWYELGNYALLGLVCAAAAVLFIKLLYAFEDFFDGLKKVHFIFKPVLGAIGLGLIGMLTVHFLDGAQHGEPLVYGNSYPLIGHCIGAEVGESVTGLNLTIGVLLLLFVLKLLATCFTLGSGGSGGIFAPALFLGAVIGYAFGLVVQQTPWFSGATPQGYALVGMAAAVAATTHAPMAAILILFELTRDYRVILPAMLSATVALVVAQLLCRDSIYSLKLHRRGVHYETRANTAILRRLTVRMVMLPDYAVVHDDTPLSEVMRRAADLEVSDFIVVDKDEHYHGLLIAADIRTALLQPQALPLLVAGELARQVPTVGPAETLDEVLNKFSRMDVNRLAVHSETDDDRFIGMISRAALMRRYQKELTGT